VSRLLLLAAFSLVGCPAPPTEPPPPPRKAELVPAPPNARGARAAGTDAAPKPELGVPVGDDPIAPAPSTEPSPEGAPPDSSATPDGGMAL
jgi:hypothetical protein